VLDPFSTTLGSTGSKVGEDVVGLDMHKRAPIRTLMFVDRSSGVTGLMHDGRNRGIRFDIHRLHAALLGTN
jgi:hypothetical protein